MMQRNQTRILQEKGKLMGYQDDMEEWTMYQRRREIHLQELVNLNEAISLEISTLIKRSDELRVKVHQLSEMMESVRPSKVKPLTEEHDE